MTRHHEHGLPSWMFWAMVFLISVAVALMNLCIVLSTWFLGSRQVELIQRITDSSGVLAGVLLSALPKALLAAAAAALVAGLAPACAGGGLPEMKGFLNGSTAEKGHFTLRSLLVRVTGLILSVSAGLPIGREGPSITAGCVAGFGIVRLLARRSVRRWVNLDTTDAGCLPALMVDEERLVFAERIGCAVGGAAGIATIFNAPIGGLLYMLEEVTVTSWAPELTLKAICCTVLACLGNVALLELCGRNVTDFLIFTNSQSNRMWGWQDMPLFVLLSAAMGAASALYTRALAGMFALRKKWYGQPSPGSLRARCPRAARVLETSVYALLCALVFGGISTASSCSGLRVEKDDGIRLNCSEGRFNHVATLLLNGPEEAIKFLYSRDATSGDPGMDVRDLAMALVVYVVLNIGMMGLAVPMGTFIPFMFAGAVGGRIVGEVLQLAGLPFALARPSAYALIGSAALLAGSLRQTLAVVVFLMECFNNLDMISPLLVAVFVAHMVSKQLTHHGLDEQLIVIKGVQYLDAETPPELDTACHTAATLCTPLPDGARLPRLASVAAVHRALALEAMSSFPIVDDSTCVGVVTRKRLAAALAAYLKNLRDRERSLRTSPTDGSVADDTAVVETYIAEMFTTDVLESSTVTTTSSGGRALLPLFRIMDAAPYVLLTSTPAPRLFPLFTRLGISEACVVSSTGELYGVLSRATLIEAAHRAGHHGKHEEHNEHEEPDLECGSTGSGSSDISTSFSNEEGLTHHPRGATAPEGPGAAAQRASSGSSAESAGSAGLGGLGDISLGGGAAATVGGGGQETQRVALLQQRIAELEVALAASQQQQQRPSPPTDTVAGDLPAQLSQSTQPAQAVPQAP